MRSVGSEDALAEATRLEREAEKVQGESPGSTDSGSDEVKSAADVGFASETAEQLAEDEGLDPGSIPATGRSGATVADVRKAAS